MNDIINPFEFDLEKSQLDLGVSNGNFPADLYQQIPCTIAFTYMRFEVDGSARPCCVYPSPFGNINKSKFDEIWHSLEYYSWRSKFLRIHQTRFHLKDKEFGFCQVCPHITINLESAELLAIQRN